MREYQSKADAVVVAIYHKIKTFLCRLIMKLLITVVELIIKV